MIEERKSELPREMNDKLKTKKEQLRQKAKEIKNKKKTVLKGKWVAAPLQLMAGQLDHLANHILAEAQKWKRTFIEKKSLLSKHKCLYFFIFFNKVSVRFINVHMVNIKEKTIHQISLIVYSLFLLHCIPSISIILHFPH